MLEILLGILTTIIGLWLSSVELRFRKMSENLNKIPTREEVRDTIDMKQETVKALQAEIKEDISELKGKLDKLIEIQMNDRT